MKKLSVLALLSLNFPVAAQELVHPFLVNDQNVGSRYDYYLGASAIPGATQTYVVQEWDKLYQREKRWVTQNTLPQHPKLAVGNDELIVYSGGYTLNLAQVTWMNFDKRHAPNYVIKTDLKSRHCDFKPYDRVEVVTAMTIAGNRVALAVGYDETFSNTVATVLAIPLQENEGKCGSVFLGGVGKADLNIQPVDGQDIIAVTGQSVTEFIKAESFYEKHEENHISKSSASVAHFQNATAEELDELF
ncbi:hypothetical protein [Enterovibrio norvegicus]|uniref:hypothetical protein n=1 Tax=Enterovibrio norvegicus TaxID=188144 RepID=UPI00352CA508